MATRCCLGSPGQIREDSSAKRLSCPMLQMAITASAAVDGSLADGDAAEAREIVAGPRQYVCDVAEVSSAFVGDIDLQEREGLSLRLRD